MNSNKSDALGPDLVVQAYRIDWACGRPAPWIRPPTSPNCGKRRWSCSVFKNWISITSGPFQQKWRVLYNYDISVVQQVGMIINGFARLVKVRSCSSGSSLMFWLCDTPLVCEFQMWGRCGKQTDANWFHLTCATSYMYFVSKHIYVGITSGQFAGKCHFQDWCYF